MNIPHKKIITNIMALHSIGMLSKELLILAHDSPTKFVRKVEEILLKPNGMMEFKFKDSDGNDVTFYIHSGWVEYIRNFYNESKKDNPWGNKIECIKILRQVASYDKEHAVIFTNAANPRNMSLTINHLGLFHSKQAFHDNNLFNIVF